VATCKHGCGLPVRWIKATGGWKCLNEDGTDHWDRCSEARTKRVMAEGVPFKDPQGEGFIFDGKKKYFQMMARTEFGKPVKQFKGETR